MELRLAIIIETIRVMVVIKMRRRRTTTDQEVELKLTIIGAWQFECYGNCPSWPPMSVSTRFTISALGIFFFIIIFLAFTQ